jgi:glutathione S-transferase
MREFVVPSVFFDKSKGPDTAKIENAVPEIDKCAKALDDALSKSPYLAGPHLTYADMHVLPILATAMGFPATESVLSKYKSLSAYIAGLTELPSYKNTAPPPRK